MKKNITTTQGQTVLWAQQLGQLMSNVEYVMENRQRIEWFQQSVLPIARIAQEQLNKVQREHCVIEDEKVKMHPLSEEDQKAGVQAKPVLLEGKTLEEFDKKSNEIWNKLAMVAI